MIKSGKFIPGWYAVLPSNHLLTCNKPLAITRFSLPIVLWRQANKEVVALLDRCPHRGAKLSLGKIVNNCIECPFHGFQFNRQAQCTYAPEFAKALPGLMARSFSAYEAFGMIWVYFGEDRTLFSYPELAKLDQHFATKSRLERVWHSPVSYCIENQLDYTHLKFVHHNTLGRGFKMPTAPEIFCDERRINIFLNDPKNPAISFFFPNTWVLHISSKIHLVLYFTPINEYQTQLYLHVYRNFLTQPVIKQITNFILHFSNLIILKQDEKVVASQGNEPSYLAENDLLMKHDKAIRYFRKQCLEKSFILDLNTLTN